MDDFLRRFGEPDGSGGYSFSHSREGLIVGMLSIGTLVGESSVSPTSNLPFASTILYCTPLLCNWKAYTNDYQVQELISPRRSDGKLRLQLCRTSTLHVVFLLDLLHWHFDPSGSS